MDHPKVSKEEMLARIVRYPDAYTKETAVPMMFIDSILPNHQRLNYAVAGDTAAENPRLQGAAATAAQIPARHVSADARLRPRHAHPRLHRSVPPPRR